MPSHCHILVVDDEIRVRKMLQRYLEQEGFQVTAVADGESARGALTEHRIALVLLDLVLPDVDGLQLAREIRTESGVPIIMLTGRGEMVDRVVGLEVGADDYVAKPFHLREVLARMHSVLRRVEPARSARYQAPPDDADAGAVYGFEGWRLDTAQRLLTGPDGQPVSLTRGEFDLLCAFVERPQRTLSREVLMELTKGRTHEAYDRAVDAQVARLRRKIELQPARPGLIKAVHGVGYYFAVRVTRA